MDKATIVKTVAYRMGNIRNMDSIINTEIDITVDRLEGQEFCPWFLLSENNYYEGLAGENRIPVPAGFIREYEEGALYLSKSDGTVRLLCKKSQDQLTDLMGTTGVPTHYALTNQYFRVFPIPLEDFKVELLFFRKSATISAGENPWFTHAAELIIAETLWSLLASRRDKTADYWKGVSNDQLVRLKARDMERRISNQELTMGGEY